MTNPRLTGAMWRAIHKLRAGEWRTITYESRPTIRALLRRGLIVQRHVDPDFEYTLTDAGVSLIRARQNARRNVR